MQFVVPQLNLNLVLKGRVVILSYLTRNAVNLHTIFGIVGNKRLGPVHVNYTKSPLHVGNLLVPTSKCELQ